jgi:hypothetical protein
MEFYLSIYLSIYLLLYSPCGTRRFFSYTDSTIPWTGDQPVPSPLPTLRTTQTQNKYTHRHLCLEWDSKPRSQYCSGRRRFMPLHRAATVIDKMKFWESQNGKQNYTHNLLVRVLFESHWYLILSNLIYVWLEILTTVVMENPVFWDITLCSPLKVKRRFGGTCRLHLHEFSLFGLFFVPEDGGDVDFKRNTRSYIPEDRSFQI